MYVFASVVSIVK